MRIISKSALRDFWQRHPDAERALDEWYHIARAADWSTPDRVKARFASASIIPGDRVVFNIKGNSYRLVVGIDYRRQAIYVKFIGTHAEYDRINATEV